MPIFVYCGLGTSNEITASRNLANIETHVFNLVFFTFRRFRRRYWLVTHGIGQELGHVVCSFVCLFTGAIDPPIYHKYYLESRGQDVVTNLSPLSFNAALINL